MICPTYTGHAAGIVIARAEPTRNPDMYIDYRLGIPLSKITLRGDGATPMDRDSIIAKTTAFAARHAHACFSVLRLWSSPHFYPLMLGLDKRGMCSFFDDRGRCWEWKFIPKDMPYSDWSMHQQLGLRLEPYADVWGEQVWVARDLVVVMGRDERECRRFSEGVTWAVQTKPWRLEVDFWRSFVGVEGGFLEELDPVWLS